MRQSYAAYRDSGVDWLGRIPEHWQDQRLKTTVERSDIRVEPAQSETAPYVGLEHVASQTGRLLALDDEQEPTGLSNAFACGDVLFGKLRPYLAKAFCAEFDGLCSTEFLILRPERYERRYLLHLLLTNGFVSHVDSSTFGARMPRTDWEFVGDSVLPVPPQREQAAIAGFLDTETARIDKLITMQESLIERLDEYRTALVTRVVTKGLPPEAAEAAGLDPEPALKDSGVKWLGHVPEHWDVTRLSALARSGVDAFTDGDWVELPYITDSGVRLIQTGNVGIGQYREQGFRYIDEGSFDELRCTEVCVGDVLICRLADPVGRACIAPDLGVRMITSVDVCILKPDERHSARYLVHMLSTKCYLSYVESLVRGGTRDRISRSMLGAIRVATPPTVEQRVIVEYLDEATGHIDALRAKAELSIERLSEYRSALISAAVTGKIDVREAAVAGSGGGV